MKYNSLIPELSVQNINTSLNFYVKKLGFSIEYERKNEGFAFLSLGESQIMLDEIGKGRDWKTSTFEYPLGRGINFQIQIQNIDILFCTLQKEKIPFFMEIEEKWYDCKDAENGNKQFIIQDPDGYLIRFQENLGQRKKSKENL